MSMRLYSVILRGGSNYRPSTSLWYIPNRDPSTDPHAGPGAPMNHSQQAYMLASMTRMSARGTTGFVPLPVRCRGGGG